MEKHTPGWTPKDTLQPDEGQTSQRLEPAEKAKEKPTKKMSRTKEAVEKGPAEQKPIKIKLRRPD